MQIGYLKQADLFITHGGFNSIKEATLLGVPMIVAPLLCGSTLQRRGLKTSMSIYIYLWYNFIYIMIYFYTYTHTYIHRYVILHTES